MDREGPCFHCGIEHTPLWRHGPPEKPLLCNACGSRWRLRGTLDEYIPKHGFTESSKLNLPLNENLVMSLEDDKTMKSYLIDKLEEVHNCSSRCEDNTNSGSRSGSQGSSFGSYTQTDSPSAEVIGFPFSIEVPRKKRSILRQYYLTPIGRLHRQLLQILQEQQSNAAAPTAAPTAEDDLLIISENAMMSSNETAVGAMLLK